MTCHLDNYLGAYVIGALDPEDTEMMQAHLMECRPCHSEMLSLARIPPLLHCVRPEDLAELESATDDDPGSTRRRPHRRRLTAAAMSLTAAAAIGVSVAAGTSGSPHAPVMHAVDATTHVSAAVTMRDRSWGTELELSLSGVYRGDRCSLIAHARDGRTEVAASWAASDQGTAQVPGATAIPANQLRELDVITTSGHRLVQLIVPQTK